MGKVVDGAKLFWEKAIVDESGDFLQNMLWIVLIVVGAALVLTPLGTMLKEGIEGLTDQLRSELGK